jgi:xanthine dehydrogenase accessory factor
MIGRSSGGSSDLRLPDAAPIPLQCLAGFEVIVIDPRSAFATPKRFPKTPISPEWPETALPRLGLDCYTAVAVLAHEPRIDDPALGAALHAKCFYIGALCSRLTHARCLERMRAAGFSEVGRLPYGIYFPRRWLN